MVCCASYWQRHSVDEAGVVGVQLQKLLFFLSAMTALTLLAMEMTTALAAASALMLYAIGLIGAQKRDIRYLWTYGFVSILIIVLSLIGGLVLVGLLTVNMSHAEHTAPRTWMVQHGMATMTSRTATSLPLATPHGTLPHSSQHGVFEFTEGRNTKVHPELAVLAPHKRGIEYDECEITAFGWGMLALGSLLGLLLFAIKIKTIALAFRMRRMLVALAAQRLPVTVPSVGTSSAAAAICNAANACPKTAGPAPATRRECERCTFVNVAGPTRCAMCDSPLPLVTAPAQWSGVPKVYVAGQFPMNQL